MFFFLRLRFCACLFLYTAEHCCKRLSTLEKETTALLCGDLQPTWSQGSSDRRWIIKVQREFPLIICHLLNSVDNSQMKKGNGCLCRASHGPNITQWPEKAVCYIQLLVRLHIRGSLASIHLTANVKNAKIGRSETNWVEQDHALWRTDSWQIFSSRVSMYLGGWWLHNWENKTSSWKSARIKQPYGWVIVFGSCLCPFFCVSSQRVRLAEVGGWLS